MQACKTIILQFVTLFNLLAIKIKINNFWGTNGGQICKKCKKNIKKYSILQKAK